MHNVNLFLENALVKLSLYPGQVCISLQADAFEKGMIYLFFRAQP